MVYPVYAEMIIAPVDANFWYEKFFNIFFRFVLIRLNSMYVHVPVAC